MKYRWEQNYAKHSMSLKNNPLIKIRGHFSFFMEHPRNRL